MATSFIAPMPNIIPNNRSIKIIVEWKYYKIIETNLTYQIWHALACYQHSNKYTQSKRKKKDVEIYNFQLKLKILWIWSKDNLTG